MENPRRTSARKVVRPPLNTADPIVARAATVLSPLEPEDTRKAWPMWTE